MGLRTLALPEDLGGVGADALTCCIVTEELAAGDTDVAAVLARDVGARAAAVLGDDAGAARTLRPAFLDDDDYHLALACREPRRRQRARHQLSPPAPDDARSPPPQPATAMHWIINGAKDRVANAPHRQADRGRGADRQGRRRCSWCRATRRASPSREQPEPRWYHGSCGAACAEGLSACRPRTCSASERRASTAGRAAPARPGAQSRHRPRRLRGRAGVRAASRAGRPPHRRASGDRHQARRDRDPARRRAHRHLARGLGVRPSRTPSPTAACPTCRSPPSPRCSPPRRSIAPPRTPPNASAPWA